MLLAGIVSTRPCAGLQTTNEGLSGGGGGGSSSRSTRCFCSSEAPPASVLQEVASEGHPSRSRAKFCAGAAAESQTGSFLNTFKKEMS